MKHHLSTILFLSLSQILLSQDGAVLEHIKVECYYQADAQDADDTDGGSLMLGATTYRIYADLQEGYTVQAVFGNELNLLELSTSTIFFNNEDRGEETGDAIDDSRVDENTVALDSWVTIGAATDAHIGLPKSIDTDGSILFPNDLELLANQPASPEFLPFLTQSDGLLPASPILAVSKSPGLDLSMFGDVNGGPLFFVGGPDYGSAGDTWFVADGVSGADSTNQVLLGQFTTDGDFSFRLNIQVGSLDDSFSGQFVAELDPEYTPAIQVFEHPELMQEMVVCNLFTTGLVEYQGLNNALSVFPNPSKDEFTINLQTEVDSGMVDFILLDHHGRSVKNGTLFLDNGMGLAYVSTADLASGIYILRVEVDGQVGMKRILKY